MPTIDELLRDPVTDLSDPIRLFADGEFRWGACAAILYDPRRPDAADLFPQPFLYHLYERARLSGQRHPVPLDLAARRGLGLLPTLFCGMTNLGPDAVCAYLSQRAVCVVGEWRPVLPAPDTWIRAEDGQLYPPYDIASADAPKRFVPLGFCFPSTPPTTTPAALTGIPSASLFAGYTIFSEVWRQPQQTVLMYLGLAWLFHTFALAAIHGSRYADNHLTARWTRRFGFRDCGTLPACMTPADGVGPLVPGVFSSLKREEFERNLREVLEAVRNGVTTPSGTPGTTPAAI